VKKSVWISYDLGVKGDYEGLYSWLDDHEAIECGNSVAFVRFEVKNEKDFLLNLKKDLESKINFKPGDRIYAVRNEIKDGVRTAKGGFLLGKRKSNPWEGFGSKVDNSIEGDE